MLTRVLDEWITINHDGKQSAIYVEHLIDISKISYISPTYSTIGPGPVCNFNIIVDGQMVTLHGVGARSQLYVKVEVQDEDCKS